MIKSIPNLSLFAMAQQVKRQPNVKQNPNLFKPVYDSVSFSGVKKVSDKSETETPKSSKFIMLGAPGAGKGSLVKEMLKELNVPHVETGGMFRAAIRGGTEVGLKAKSYIDKGELVPDKVVIELVKERLSQDDCKDGFILDGFPRTVPQARALNKMMKSIDPKSELKVINVGADLTNDELMKRISGRKSCPDCGAIYNIYFKPSKEEGICDFDQAELTQRSDDNPESVKVRLDKYEKETKPLINFFMKQGKLINPKGKQTSTILASLKEQVDFSKKD